MLKSNILDKVFMGESRWKVFSPFLLLPVVTLVIALLIGIPLGLFGSYALTIVIGTMIMVIIITLRQDELAATLIVLVRLYFDWYLGLGVIAQLMTLALLLIFYLARSERYPWVVPRVLWLWVLLLVLAFFPAIRGITLADGIYYFSNIIFSAFIIFWLGIVIGRDRASVQRFFIFFSIFGTLIAIHAIIQATTGMFLFKSDRFDTYLTQVANDYQLTQGIYRIGSFLVNPDSSGGFFAMMVLISLGLFAASSSLLGKILYSVEIFLAFIALLFSYSTGGWIPVFAAFIPFVLLVGSTFYRILLPLFGFIIAATITTYFHSQVNLLIQHSLDPNETSLRVGAWMTGIQVIRAFPLTGIGLGRYDYVIRANPYRVPAQYYPLYHPHNSYLELAALGGLPLALVFLVLLSTAIWLVLRNWVASDAKTRSLLAGGVASLIALSINSLVNPGWTLPPLAAAGWLILGVISSPLLLKNSDRVITKRDDKSITNDSLR